jgi:uncharacterized coiled-coil protein SlyX
MPRQRDVGSKRAYQPVDHAHAANARKPRGLVRSDPRRCVRPRCTQLEIDYYLAPTMSTEGDTMRGRIEELEVHAAFQARTIEELDQVVREFSERVLRLDRELKELRAQLESSGAIRPGGRDVESEEELDDATDSADERETG